MNERGSLYFDHHATTPVARQIIESMAPYWGEHFGNPSGQTHAWAFRAERAVERARRQLADLVGCEPSEIVFVSGATEANNLAIRGVRLPTDRPGVVTQATEHPSILEPVRARAGANAEVVSVDGDGVLDLNGLRQAVGPETGLVTVMAANNEIGTLQPLEQVSEHCRANGVLLHTDATQAPGRLDLRAIWPLVDLLSLSAHKFYGPKGVGALIVRRRRPRVSIEPLLLGGGQERGVRAGTTNVPGIVGLGAAAALALDELGRESDRLRALRDDFEGALSNRISGVSFLGGRNRLPNNSSVCIDGVGTDALALELRGIAVSAGSACASGSGKASHVLEAIDRVPDHSRGVLRFGFGRENRAHNVEEAVEALVAGVTRLRATGR